MEEKTLLSVSVLLMFSSLAALIFWAGPNLADWGRTRTILTSSGIALLGLAGSIYAFLITEHIDQRTLFETRIESAQKLSAPGTYIMHRETFDIEHPGTAHKIMLAPKLGFAEEAETTFNLQIKLMNGSNPLLISETLQFEPVLINKTDRNGARYDYSVYEEVYLEFIPPALGQVTLEIEYLFGQTPDFYIWVEDPLKTDGKRNPALRN